MRSSVATIDILIKAIKEKNLAKVKIAVSIDLLLQRQYSSTPIVQAAESHCPTILKHLIKLGGDVNKKAGNDPMDMGKALAFCLETKHFNIFTKRDLAHRLLKYGANPNHSYHHWGKKGSYGNLLSIQLAALIGDSSIILALLKAGALINHNNDGFTAVYLAARKGHYAALKTLLLHGGWDNSAFKVAMDKSYLTCAELIRNFSEGKILTIQRKKELAKQEEQKAIKKELEYSYLIVALDFIFSSWHRDIPAEVCFKILSMLPTTDSLNIDNIFSRFNHTGEVKNITLDGIKHTLTLQRIKCLLEKKPNFFNRFSNDEQQLRKKMKLTFFDVKKNKEEKIEIINKDIENFKKANPDENSDFFQTLKKYHLG